jgi:hypothetical protein
MDYNWLRIWHKELSALSGKTIDERIKSVFYIEDRFFDFISFLKGNVPEGEKVRPAIRPNSSKYDLLAKYHMLPVKTSAEGDYLWVYNGSNIMDISFDPITRSIMEGDRVVLSPVRLVAAFGDAGAVYKVEKEEE